MAAGRRTLIVGGGIGGLTLAVALRRQGISAEVIELENRVLGVGITLTGTALRALNTVGLAKGCVERGFSFDFFEVSDGTGVAQAKNPLAKPDPTLPGAVGITRPILADLLTNAATEEGATIRRGLTVDRLEQDGSGVDVRFTDASAGRYDLVVGADGVFSQTRKRIFGSSHEPLYVGQGVLRFTTARIRSIGNVRIRRAEVKAGFAHER